MRREMTKQSKSNASTLLILSIFISCLTAATGLLLTLIPYPALKQVVDRLTSDGDAKPFTPELHASLNSYYLLLFLVGAGLCLFFMLRKRSVLSWYGKLMNWTGSFLRQIGLSLQQMLLDIRKSAPDRWEALIIVVLVIFAVILRLHKFDEPLTYDESYTYIAFASESLWTVISDYHLPNNHVLHSLLVHIFTNLVGSGMPWAVRMPAFIAGTLLVPAVYFLARKLYNIPVAIITACLIAAHPHLILYSAEARGYSLLGLFTILSFLVGMYLLRNKSLAGWILLAALCALGFYTVPVMLYPFGCLMVWLFISMLVDDFSPSYTSRKAFLIYLVLSGILTGILTIFLYAPILIISGPDALFSNTFVERVEWNVFVWRMKTMLASTWIDHWFPGVSVWARVAVVIAFFGSLIFHWKKTKFRVPIQAASVLWIVLEIMVHRPDTLPRVWTFLLPLFLMWCAVGITAPIEYIRLPRLQLQTPSLLSFGVIGILFLSVIRTSTASSIDFNLDVGDARLTAGQLQKILQPGDMIIVAFPAEAPLEYYAQITDVPLTYFHRLKQADREFTRAFVVISPQFEQTVQSVIEERRLDPNRFDLESKQLVSSFGIYVVYEVRAAETSN